MRVKDILRHKGEHVVSVKETDLLTDAIRLMHDERIGAVAVLDSNGQLAGMLSEREVVDTLARDPDRALRRRCGELMLSEAPTCQAETSIHDLAKTMTQVRVRHIPVLEDENIVGIISIGDITKAQLNEKQLENGVLQDLLRGARGTIA